MKANKVPPKTVPRPPQMRSPLSDSVCGPGQSHSRSPGRVSYPDRILFPTTHSNPGFNCTKMMVVLQKIPKLPFSKVTWGESSRKDFKHRALFLSQPQVASHVEPHETSNRWDKGQQNRSSPGKTWEPVGVHWSHDPPALRAADSPIRVGPGEHFYNTGVLRRRPHLGMTTVPSSCLVAITLGHMAARCQERRLGGLQSQMLHLLPPHRGLL